MTEQNEQIHHRNGQRPACRADHGADGRYGHRRLSPARKKSRKLVFESADGRYRYIMVKPSDVPTYVDHGVADVGIVVRITLMEKTVPYMKCWISDSASAASASAVTLSRSRSKKHTFVLRPNTPVSQGRFLLRAAARSRSSSSTVRLNLVR